MAVGNRVVTHHTPRQLNNHQREFRQTAHTFCVQVVYHHRNCHHTAGEFTAKPPNVSNGIGSGRDVQKGHCRIAINKKCWVRHPLAPIVPTAQQQIAEELTANLTGERLLLSGDWLIAQIVLVNGWDARQRLGDGYPSYAAEHRSNNPSLPSSHRIREFLELIVLVPAAKKYIHSPLALPQEFPNSRPAGLCVRNLR